MSRCGYQAPGCGARCSVLGASKDRIFPGRFLTGTDRTEADRSCEKRSRLVGINIRVVLKESLLHPRHERVRSEQAEEHAARDGDRPLGDVLGHVAAPDYRGAGAHRVTHHASDGHANRVAARRQADRRDLRAIAPLREERDDERLHEHRREQGALLLLLRRLFLLVGVGELRLSLRQLVAAAVPREDRLVQLAKAEEEEEADGEVVRDLLGYLRVIRDSRVGETTRVCVCETNSFFGLRRLIGG